MKKFLKSLVLFAAAAMALTSCENEIFDENIESNDNVVTMTFNAGAPESKTAVSIDGNVATFTWSAGDKVGFFKQAKGLEIDQATNGTGDGKISVIEKANSTNTAETGATATFTTELHTADGANGYQIGAFFPGNAWKSYDYTNGISAVRVAIPATQKPVATSFDSQADLMMSKMIEVEELDNNTEYTLNFARLAAIGCMTLKGVEAGETITNVTITFDESAVVNGNVELNFVGGYAKYAEEGSNVITLTPTDVTALAEGTPIYFTCFPGAYTGALTVTVATTAENSTATYTKVIETLPSALTFTAGDVTKFNLTVAESAREEVAGVWTLVTDASTLAAGDQIIIAASGSNYALGTTQNTNNRVAVAITKDGDTLKTPGADVQVITLEAGVSTGTWALSVGEGSYLFAAGGTGKNNYLKTTSTLNAAASWNITIANTGVATIKTSDNTVARHTLMKNSSSAIFSCYASGQSTVCIYKLVGGNAGGGETPEPEEPENPGTGGEVTITFNGGAGQKDGLTWEESPITVVANTNGGQYAPNEHSGDSHLRLYNKNTLTFSGATITKIVFTFDTAQTLAASEGTYSDGTWTGSANSVTFTNNAAGQAKITSVTITYGGGSGEGGEEPETPATPVELVMSDVTCSAQTETSLTFTWTAVENAIAYQVYFDGVDKGTTEDLTYTATGLTAGTTHTIAVKAVGDGANYATSSTAKTAQGTTKTAQQGGEGEGGESTESLTFSSLDLSNGADLGTYSIGDVSVAFGKGTNNSNSPKYYTSDATARYYVNNTITFTSEKTITKIVITHKSNSYAKITDYTATDGVVTWTGSSQSVQFTGSNSGRIVSVEVTYAN